MSKLVITSLLILSFIIISSISFDEVFALELKDHTPPTIIYDRIAYDENATVNLRCVNYDPIGVRKVMWTVPRTDQHERVHVERLLDYSFPATRFLEDGDKIKCKLVWDDRHTISSGWVTSSNFKSLLTYDGISVKLVEDQSITNNVDMDYNPTTKDLTISWDFGDNPDRDTCNSKTEFYQDNYTSINPIKYDSGGGYHNFEGYNKDTLGEHSLTISDTDLIESEIDCQGSLTIYIDTLHPSNYTDEFSLYMTFFEVISPDKRNDVKYQDDIRPDGIIVLNEANFITSDIIDIEERVCGNLDPGMDDWRFVELVHDITGATLTKFATVEACFTDSNSNQTSPPIEQTQSKKKNNGSGCSGDCTAPTIGVDKSGVRFVEDGLELNGVLFNGDYFKNHMPMQYTEIGKMNHLSLKVYENSGLYNIEKIQFAIVKEIGSPLNLAEPRIEIDVSNFANDVENPSLDGFILIDKEEIISYYDVTVSTVPCMDNSTQECLKLDIYWSFGKVPEFNVLAINGWDNDRNSFTSYFNDGMTVTDPNYVEPEDTPQYKYECKDSPLDEIKVQTRMNCNFDDIIITEQGKAALIFDSTKLISELSESFYYDLPQSTEEQEAELDIRINNEIDRLIPLTKDYAKNQYLYQKDSYNHWNYFGEMTVAEINKLDMENKQKLQNELLQQRLDDKAKYG